MQHNTLARQAMPNTPRSQTLKRRLGSRSAALLGVCLLTLGLVACGGGDASGGGGTGVASLGLDPLGRGDGIDLTESDYAGRCYQDNAMEANRPRLPDPRKVAADDAEAQAISSAALAETERVELAAAKQALDASFAVTSTTTASSSAGLLYLVGLSLAKTATEDAYQKGLVLLAPEKVVTLQDLIDNSDKLIAEKINTFFASATSFNPASAPGALDIAAGVLGKSAKAGILGLLKDARDIALALSNGQVAPPGMAPVVDPALQSAFELAQGDYDTARDQAIADGEATFAALLYYQNEPSDFAPCDADELANVLREAFCTGNFVNPITDEDEVDIPGLRARLDAYKTKVCLAVG
jgi:hypothetical protein